MDLAKVGTIQQVVVESTGPGDHDQFRVNKLLSEGWVLVSVKTVPHTTDNFGHKEVSHVTVFILGKPREKPKLLEQQSEEWRREHLAIDDANHPDFMLHAKGSS